MSSPQDFTCVFCNDAFEDKESLQEHFRKHGDPKFNNVSKNKGRSQNDQASSGEKSEDGEMVGCDVCDEVFPSISKAITHKHKVHPDHDTKHFCPWCGKLFTMKHLYNKHIQSNHSNTPTTDEIQYHCDSCVVDFFVVSAMVYHNKFFHRQDTELPSIGHSKKVKTYNQEMIQIYYCPFCGEEYNNKVNLHKHMGDDHSDENQSPEEVLRCPLCDAVFYHLDAYELHLSFHTSDDVYSDETEVSDITDFSLESVPPIMEKVEEETKNVENEGIDKFLQLVMDESRESGNTDASDRPKSKKHKKHKKSKKAAITLDEFLNMNKDVFGDGLDVQGIEEVPTQQVLKKYKGKKDNVKPIPASALAKLKKQGITVKSNSGIKSPILKTNRNLTVNTAKIIPNRIPHIQEKHKPVATSNELLTKLLNQGNSQIKIIKKTTSEKATTDNIFSQPDYQEPNSSTINSTANDPDESKHDEMAQDTDNVQTEDSPNDREVINNDNNINRTDMEYSSDCEQPVNKENNDSKNLLDIVSKSDNLEQVKSYDNSLKINTIQNTTENKTDMDMSDKDDNYETTEETTEPKASDDEEIPSTTHSTSSNAHFQLENIKKTQSPNKSLEALKHLSGLITVKSTSNTEDKSKVTDTAQLTTDNDDEEMDDELPLNIAKIMPKNIQNMAMKKQHSPQIKPDTPPKSMDSFKNLSKQLTIKPCISPSATSKGDDESAGEDDSYNYESHDNVPGQNTNDNGFFKTPMSVTKPSTTGKPNNSHPSDLKKPVQVRNPPKEVSKEDDTKKAFNMDILKRLTNVTAKPVVKATNNVQTTSTSNQSANSPRPLIAKLEKNKQIDQDIEIFNIDDSDSDQELTNEESSPKPVANMPKIYEATPVKTATPVNVLKNLGKNIIVKPSSSPNKNILNIKKEVQGESSRISSDRNIRSPGTNDGKVNTHTKQMNMTLNHTLKKLGNNISIKSQFSTINSQKYQMQHDEDMDDNFDMNDEESDSETSNKVKITEVNEEDDLPSDTDMEYNENVIVQSPHASNSENEEETHNTHSEDEINEDLEKQIKINTLPKTNSASTCLDNFKRNNRELTIKSLSDKNTEFPQVGSPGNKKEEPMRIAKSVPKDTSNKQFREAERNEDSEVLSKNNNQSAASSSSSQKVTNQVNTVKTVKTFQSETIIEEITTTVTKTIRTVNQSSKQVAQNANVSTPRPRLKAPNQQGKPLQGMTVRNAQTVGTKIRCAAPRPTIAVPARPTGQLVPVRTQNQLVPRPSFRATAPGPSNVRKMSPQLNIQKPVIGKPLKISPLAMNQSVKRPSEDVSGHFSCFKKPKDTVMPQMDAFDDDFGDDSTANYSSASSSRSDFSSTATKVVKGKSVVTAMQRSEQHSEQHITRLNNMSGLKVVRTSAKQATQVETRNDMSAANRTAMDAIERLQKQGLLIKKPRVETTEENEQYHSDDDDDYEEK